MPRSRPRASTDHILVAVRDLTEAARRFETTYGLRALEGGRHPGVGTANMIIPLGSTYLELIAVVDNAEGERSRMTRRITRAVEDGRTFATWAVRTDNLDALREHLLGAGLELAPPVAGARQRPDGVTLRWRSQMLVEPGEPSVLPFVIEWQVPPGQHPAEAKVEHPSKARGIRTVRLGDPNPDAAGARFRELLGEDLNVAFERAAASGVAAVELDTPGGALTVV
ncbi:MAG TPA: VOC family protein [bacterium]|nr:VOC family protein [bacterium]